MDCEVAGSAREMEALALEAAGRGDLVLTPASRLAKRYRHAYRMQMRMRGTGGALSWKTPEVASFRRWVKTCFEGLWATDAPAGKAAQLALWAEALEMARRGGVPPPEGLGASPALFSQLQEAHDRLRESGTGDSSADGGAVFEWRAEVARRFEALAKSRGLLLWHEVQEAVRAALEDGRIPAPRGALVILRETPAPEPLERFLRTLSARCETRVYGPPRLGEPPHKPPCLVLATPEQECRHVCSRALAEWNGTGGRESLAIAVLDEAYFPLLERCLDELAGRRPLGGKEEIRYNIAWGPALTQHPLFQTAVLPLRLAASGDPVAALAAFVRSPYADPGRFEGADEVFARLWRKGRVVSLEAALEDLVGRFPELAPLRLLQSPNSAPLGAWVSRLRGCWKSLGFPWKAGSRSVRDQNATAEAQLREALEEAEAHCRGVVVDADGALSWITVLCASQRVTEPTAETAGIQVLSAGDAFGLPFDHVWAVGAHGEALPRARTAHPLLSPSEALAVAGGDLQRRGWEEGNGVLQDLIAACPAGESPHFTRAKSEVGGERPYLGSPILADRFGPGGEGEAVVFDVWGRERDLWLAAPWLGAAAEGLASPEIPGSPVPDAVPVTLASPLSVTHLDALLKCPFRHFAAAVLGLEALPQPVEGVSPVERGGVIHEILGRFARELPEGVPASPGKSGEAWTLLRRIALERLDSERGPFWSAERTRLLGEDEGGTRGLLRAWIEKESEWAQRGWRHEPPADERGERPFRGLRMAGVEVEGRADRVDRHPEQGRIVWDYKTGDPPGPRQVIADMSEAQLPAYLLALKAGLMDLDAEGNPTPWNRAASAGYVPLKKAEKIELKPMPLESLEGGADGFLRRWIEHVEGRLEGPLRGLYPADPRRAAAAPGERGTPCEHCPFPPLCGYFDAPAGGRGADEEEA